MDAPLSTTVNIDGRSDINSNGSQPIREHTGGWAGAVATFAQVSNEADPIFAEPRLAAIYDDLDPDRSDLDLYRDLVDEFDARSVIDVGCGTGTYACSLAQQGVRVTAVDPAAASLDVARSKRGARDVTWIFGDATSLPRLGADLAVMTANVAQVFLTDESFSSTLHAVAASLRPGGHLVFEVRDPARRAWESWHGRVTEGTTATEGIVNQLTEVIEVDGQRVSFRHTYRFEDGSEAVSNSTLRFRGRAEINALLDATQFDVVDVRDAPDRPGRELVFVARRRTRSTDATEQNGL